MKRLNKLFGIGMEFNKYTVYSEKLPTEFDNFKILHMSDFHCVPKQNMLTPVLAEKPDIIVMTGDMTDDRFPFGAFIALLEALLKLSPVFLVSGNHDVARADFPELVKKCRSLGAVYLMDESKKIIRGNGHIVLHGINDPIAKTSEIANKKINASLLRLERSDAYEILLFHRANKLNLFADEGFDLILSGHMHGGQFRLPHLGGVLAPKSCFPSDDRLLFPDYSGGRFRLGSTEAVVNRGMGNPVPLPRFGNPTEIVSLTLKRRG